MSVLTLKVDEVMRTLSAEGSNPFVVHDKEVDIVRFAINSGFADIVLDGQVALRVMYQRPEETEVRAQTLTYYDTDGLHNYYDWQLSQSDLTKDGSLMVALCILDISGGEVSEWHTTPCAVRVLSTIHTDDSDEGDDTITPTVKERVAVLETMIQRVASGAPIVVSSTSAMTDTNQIYVLSTNGRWYYHNGSAWVAGGEYGAVATDTTLTQAGIPADAKKVGDRISDINTDLNDISVESGENLVNESDLLTINGSTYANGWYSFKPANADALYGSDSFPHRPFKENTRYTLSFDAKYTGTQSTTLQFIFIYTDNTRSRVIVTGSAEKHYALVSTEGKTVSALNLSYNNNVLTSIKNLMVFSGATEPDEFIRYDKRTAVDVEARKRIDSARKRIDSLNTLVIDGKQRNLFSKYNALKGYLTTGGARTEDQAETNRTTDFIEVGNNAYITITTEMEVPSNTTQWQAFCFYDSSKVLIGTRHVKTGGTASIQTFTYAIPSGAIYFRASSRVFNDWRIMLQFGNVASAFEYNYDDIEYIKSVAEKKDIGGSVKGIVHRGMDLIAPENTMPAFKLAVLNGFKYIETDIALTADNIPVLLHDTSINRTARNADGTALSNTVYIYDITYEQALTYDFGIFKGSEFAGTKIPTLDEFLVFCRNTGVHPYLELKYDSHYSQTTLLSNVMKAIKKCGMLGKITFISFVRGYLDDLVPNYAPNERIGVLTGGLTTAEDVITYVLTLKNDKNEVFVDASSATSEAVANLRNNNIPLELWTLNTKTAIINVDPYVSGITSDSLDAGVVLAENALL